MNERIRLLAEQAGIEFTYDPTETPMRAFVECWEDEMAKFAELIVKECTSIVEDAVTHREPASTYVGKIKEHFGVAE